MLPQPLHPAVVHFPIVFAALLPISAALALWAIRRGTPPLHAWAFPLVLSIGLVASSWVALETGEAQEERVESIVGEQPLHQHEEAAERFMLISGIVMLVAAVGLARGPLGTAARLVASVGTVAVLAAGVQVGAAGGKLVYEHGAAAAYADPTVSPHAPALGDWESAEKYEGEGR